MIELVALDIECFTVIGIELFCFFFSLALFVYISTACH